MDAILGWLMGGGLALSAGLNAYVPMVVLGLADHFIPGFDLPEAWHWLSNEWVIVILLVLLLIEILADKIPWIDSINDIVQTVVRPAAGGIVFGASSGATTALVQDPAAFFQSNQWVPIVVGAALALGTHVVKATARPVVNAATAGVAAPVVSAAEDVISVIMSVVSIVLPWLVIVCVLGLAIWLAIGIPRARRRRRERAAAKEAATLSTQSVD